MTAREIITDALIEAAILQAGETPVAHDAEFGLSRLNRLIGSFNTQRPWLFEIVDERFTLNAVSTTYTIGPTGDFVTTRPTEILIANIVLTDGTQPVRTGLRIIRDEREWAAVSVRTVTSSVPVILYYESTVPNGTITLWPVSSATHDLETYTRRQLSTFATLDTSVDLAPGYQEAITMSLAEALCPSFGKQITPELAELARRGRVAVKNLNTKPPALYTDAPASGGRDDYNYLVGVVAR